MRIEVICTGDEILTGKTVNTNFSYISRKLEEAGLSVRWGTTVGDDRATLLEAFQIASTRADAVIVNGGLGPTVDDLSQELAAEAAGRKLVMNEYWLSRIEARYRQYGMAMSPNNRKQALLPETAELIDNPIGTACGFALDIGPARFYFTPGVPKELYMMLDEQILPRLMKRGGTATIIQVKRFHTFGIGESRADALLQDIEGLAPDRGIKLGFQTHYPQLETKLTLRGADPAELQQRLAPAEAEVRRRLGNFIVAEDEETLEGLVLSAVRRNGGSLAVIETFTSGLIAARLGLHPDAAAAFRRGLIAPSFAEIESLLGLPQSTLACPLSEEAMTTTARAALRHTGAAHVLVTFADDTARAEGVGPLFWFAIATERTVTVRRCRLRFGGDDWLRSGSVEMGLDSLRRVLTGLPMEKIDFEVG